MTQIYVETPKTEHFTQGKNGHMHTSNRMYVYVGISLSEAYTKHASQNSRMLQYEIHLEDLNITTFKIEAQNNHFMLA